MMNDCDRAEEMIRGWGEGGSVGPADLDLLQEHCASCVSCSERFGTLVPFVLRDATGASVVPSDDGPSGITEAVMVKLKGREPARTSPRLTWTLAAAAGIAICLGIGLLAFRMSANRFGTEVVVHFELAAPGAKSVAVVGSFTDWEASQLAMSDPNGDGVWEISVTLKKDAIYTYNFLIDGNRWVPDPNADTLVDDGFGGSSSVITL